MRQVLLLHFVSGRQCRLALEFSFPEPAYVRLFDACMNATCFDRDEGVIATPATR